MVNRKFVNNCSSSTNSNSMEPTNTDTEEISVHVHHVPFKLEYDGPANVDSKFTSKSVELDTESKGWLTIFPYLYHHRIYIVCCMKNA